MGAEFFQKIYNTDPTARWMGLTAPVGRTDVQNIPQSYYSGKAPNLADAANQYGTANVAPGQMTTGAPSGAPGLGNQIAGPQIRSNPGPMIRGF